MLGCFSLPRNCSKFHGRLPYRINSAATPISNMTPEKTNGGSAQALSDTDVQDILQGAAIYGSGGGGHFFEGDHYARLAKATGRQPHLIPLSSLPNESMLAGGYLLGSVCPEETLCIDTDAEPPILRALQALHTEVNAVVPIEIGVSNIALALYISALSGVPIVDADPSGRSVPECVHSTFAIAEVPVGDVVAANADGEIFMMKGVKTDGREEDLLRALCGLTSDSTLAVIDHVLPAKVLRGCLIEGTVSRALRLGKVYRAFKAKGGVAERVAREGGGKVLFNGIVEIVECKEDDGFTIGSVEIRDKNNPNKKMKLHIKNENMYAEINGEVVVTIPEIISVFDKTNGNIILNPKFDIGLEVVVIVLPAPKEFLTERGLELFGPKYLGINTPFKSAIQD